MTGFLPPRKGAANILTCHLELRPNQNIVIVFEEQSVPVATLLDEVAQEFGISATLIYVRKDTQKRATIHSNLSPSMKGAIQQADAMITCLNDSSECMAFRGKLLKLQHADIAIGHTPGISVGMLSDYFDVDIDDMKTKCQFLAYPLAIGKEIVIKTFDKEGNDHSLVTDIGGWQRLPIISNGIVPHGAWGNLLPGETYIAPIEGTGRGSIVINGSIPGLRLNEQELLLYFENGRLDNVVSDSQTILQHFNLTCKQVAELKNDANWNWLAEIGIGVNDNIRELTGKPVIDEKAYGTIHIALGDSVGLGGSNESVIHYDMVTISPTVLIDEKVLISCGNVTWDASIWQETLSNVNLPENWSSIEKIFASRSSVSISHEVAHIRRICINDAMKKMEFDIGSKDLSILGKKLLNIIPHNDMIELDINSLSSEMGVPKFIIRKILYFLHIHDLIEWIT